ncbi:hypothetical protein D3C78_1333780 [compost metagenome]
MHTDAQLAQAQPIGVLQQVAEHLQQGTLFDRHLAVLRQIETDIDPFVAIDLVQGVAQALQHRAQGHLMAYQPAFAQTGALQLVTDLLAHALDLGLQHPSLSTVLGAPGHVLADALQHRQRGFQAVGQVIEGVAIAAALLALAVE